jgi:hypothetical protein
MSSVAHFVAFIRSAKETRRSDACDTFGKLFWRRSLGYFVSKGLVGRLRLLPQPLLDAFKRDHGVGDCRAQ